MFFGSSSKSLSYKRFQYFVLSCFVFFSIAPALANHSTKLKTFSVEICSVQHQVESVSFAVDISDTNSDKHQQHQCELCCLNISSVLPLSELDFKFENPGLRAYFPQLFYRSPKLLFAWLNSPPRGPPAFS
jgi:hypothetical protein